MFDVGDVVVYPRHGACRVVGVVSREVFGEHRDYVKLVSLRDDSLVMWVPVGEESRVGLRAPLPVSELSDLAELLGRRNVRVPESWSRRFKNHQEKLASGDPYELGEVVRNLFRHRERAVLSAAEKDMLEDALDALVSELTGLFESRDAALGWVLAAVGVDRVG